MNSTRVDASWFHSLIKCCKCMVVEDIGKHDEYTVAITIGEYIAGHISTGYWEYAL